MARGLWHRVEMTPLRSLLVTLVAFVATVLLAVAAPAAQAETWRHADPRGDVVARESASEDTRVDPTARRADLTNLTVRYSAGSLRVASTIREIECFHHWELRVVTSRGDIYQLKHSTSPFDSCTEPQVQVLRNGYRYSCAGTSVHRTPAGVVATVPRSCLGSAYRVRVGVQAQDAYGDDEEPTHVYDDALRVGAYTERRPQLSRWIVAG